MNSRTSLMSRLRRVLTLARHRLARRRRRKPPPQAVQLEFGWWPRQ